MLMISKSERDEITYDSRERLFHGWSFRPKKLLHSPAVIMVLYVSYKWESIGMRVDAISDWLATSTIAWPQALRTNPNALPLVLTTVLPIPKVQITGASGSNEHRQSLSSSFHGWSSRRTSNYVVSLVSSFHPLSISLSLSLNCILYHFA